MKNLPKISIVIPSFNKAKFIGQTLQSIFKQKYPNLEVFIQDGGSRDGTVNIIKGFAKKHPEIKWESKNDKGQVDALNKGLARVSGDILTYINADDIYQRGTLKKVGEYFKKHSEILWIAGKGDIIDERGRKIFSWVTDYKNFLFKINSYQLLLVVNYLIQPSIFFSKVAYKKYGPFKGEGGVVMEYDLWLKLGRIKMPVLFNKYLSSFRIYKDTVSSTKFKKTLLLDEKISEKYTSNPFILLLHRMHNLGRVVAIKGIRF